MIFLLRCHKMVVCLGEWQLGIRKPLLFAQGSARVGHEAKSEAEDETAKTARPMEKKAR